ncbi:MAG: hypothetical protein CML06_11870 [Pseudomonadales bacterium]|nr:hypothetical protein [Pseudomonadales bacterium]
MAGQSSRTLCLGLLGWLLADWGQAPPAQAQDLAMYQPAFQYHSPLPALPPQPSLEPAAPTADPFQDYPSAADHYVPREAPGYLGRSINYLLRSRENVSSALSVMGERMDAYFAGEEYDNFDFDNDTYLRLSLDQRWIEAGRMESDVDYKFRLDLPGTKERYRLVLAYDDDNDQSLEERRRPTDGEVPTDERSLFAGLLRTLSDEGGEWETKLSGGIKVKLPPDPFVRARAKRYVTLNPQWQLELRSGAEWFNSSGFRGSFDVIFKRLLTENLLFQASTPFDWREEEDTLEFGQVFSLYQDITSRDAIRYQLAMFGTSLHSSKVNTYYVSADYRRRIHKNWLFMDLTPQLAFPREEDFQGVASLTLSLEIYFR